MQGRNCTINENITLMSQRPTTLHQATNKTDADEIYMLTAAMLAVTVEYGKYLQSKKHKIHSIK
jgi:hypothetical protein